MNFQYEIDIIKSTIDLAASIQGQFHPIDNEVKDFISFYSISNAFREVCNKSKVNKFIEQKCYQILLRMSSESENHLTWWEKFKLIRKYLPKDSEITAQKLNKTSSLPTPSQHLMKMFEPEKTIHIKPSVISTTSPGTLYEGEQLSILLNEASSAINNSPSKYSSPTIFNKSRHILGDYTNSTGSKRIHFFDEMSKSATNNTTIRSSSHNDMLEDIAVKIDSIEKETIRTKDIIARITGHIHTSPNKSSNITTPIVNSSYPQQQSNGTVAADWTLSPSAIHSILELETPDGNFINTAINNSTHINETTSISSDIKDYNDSELGRNDDELVYHRNHSSKAFSMMLRKSNAMAKYLSSTSTDHTIPPTNEITSKPLLPPQQSQSSLLLIGASQGNNTQLNEPAQVEKHVGIDKKSHQDLTPLNSSNNNNNNSNNKLSRNIVLFSPDTPSSYALYSPNEFSNQEPSHDQHHLTDVDDYNVDSLRRRRGIPVSRAAVVVEVSNKSNNNTMINFLREDGQLDMNKLDLDGLLLQGDSNYIKTVTSSMRILLIFQHWLLSKSNQRSNYYLLDQKGYHNAAMILHNHLCNMNNFVTSLFGLEQWLRDKMRLVVSMNVKAYVFTIWVLNYGVASIARTYWRRRRLHCGFESFLEYGVKRRMHRKNALHALALRRRHAHHLYMSPVLQHRPSLHNHSSSSNNNNNNISEYNASGIDSSIMNVSAIELASLNRSNRKKMQESKYSTSMSVREVLQDRKHAVVLFSRGGNNAEAHKVKTIEYLQTQDTVALLFFFRRFYHRTIYMPRMLKVRAAHFIRILKKSFLLWNEMWINRYNREKSQEPQIEYARTCVLYIKQRQAMNRLRRNINQCKEYRKHLSQYSIRIKSKSIYLRAFHMIRCASYVKSFLNLKQNYYKYSIPIKEFRRAELQQRSYSIRTYFHKWRKSFKLLNRSRLNYFKANESKQIFQSLLLNDKEIFNVLKIEEYISVNTFFALPVVNRMYIPIHLIQGTIRLLALRKAFKRLLKLGRCPRFFFSRLELSFAQFLSRASTSNERLKYLHLVNNCSCRILPTQYSRTGLQRERDLKDKSLLIDTNKIIIPSSIASKEQYLIKNKKRITEEKPYKLMIMDTKSLQFKMLIINHSNQQIENNDNSQIIIPVFAGSTAVHTIARSMALHLTNSAVLLRTLRRWRKFRRTEQCINSAKNKITFKKTSQLCKKVWLIWLSGLADEREYKYYLKRRSYQLLRKYLQSSLISSRSILKVKQYLLRLHINRLLQYKYHGNEYRRLQAGHFYNSVLEKVSAAIIRFISFHTFLPEVVRNFILNYKHYRFYIYRDLNYVQPGWERELNAAALQALSKINENYQLYNSMQLDHCQDYHLDMIQQPSKLQALHLTNHFTSKQRRQSDGPITPHAISKQSKAINTSTSRSVFRQVQSEYNASNNIEKLEMASLFMSHWVSVGLQRYHALKRGLFALKKYKIQRKYILNILKKLLHHKCHIAINSLFTHKLKHKTLKQIKFMQLRKYWFRMKVTYVEVHRKRLQGRRLFSSMYNACRYRVAIRGYVTLLKSNLKKGFERLKNNAVNIYKAQRVCSIRYKMKLLVNTFKTMFKVHVVSKWRLKRGQILLIWGLSSSYNNTIRSTDRLVAIQLYTWLRNYQIMRLHSLSTKKQRLSYMIAGYYKKTSELIRGFMALHTAVSIRNQRKGLSQNTLTERMYQNIQVFQSEHQCCYTNHYRNYNTYPVLLENTSKTELKFTGTHWESDFHDEHSMNSSDNYNYSSLQRFNQLANLRKCLSIYKSKQIVLHPNSIEAFYKLHRKSYSEYKNPSNPIVFLQGNVKKLSHIVQRHSQQSPVVLRNSSPLLLQHRYSNSNKSVYQRYDTNNSNTNNNHNTNKANTIPMYNSILNIPAKQNELHSIKSIPATHKIEFKPRINNHNNSNNHNSNNANINRNQSISPASCLISNPNIEQIITKHSLNDNDRNRNTPLRMNTSPNLAIKKHLEITNIPLSKENKKDISLINTISNNQQYIDSPDSMNSFYFDDQVINTKVIHTISGVQRPRSTLHGKYHLELRKQILNVEYLQKKYRFIRWYQSCKWKKSLRIYIRNYYKKKKLNIYLQRLKYNLSIKTWQSKAIKQSIIYQGFHILRKQLHFQYEQNMILNFAHNYYFMIIMSKSIKKWRKMIRKKQINKMRIQSAEYFNICKYYHLFFISMKISKKKHIHQPKLSKSKTKIISDSSIKTILSKTAAHSLLHYNKRKPA